MSPGVTLARESAVTLLGARQAKSPVQTPSDGDGGGDVRHRHRSTRQAGAPCGVVGGPYFPSSTAKASGAWQRLGPSLRMAIATCPMLSLERRALFPRGRREAIMAPCHWFEKSDDSRGPARTAMVFPHGEARYLFKPSISFYF